MKTVDVNQSLCIDFDTENNKEDPKVKVWDNVRISKYKNISEKGYVPNWSTEIFVIKKSQKHCVMDMLLVILTKKKLWERFPNKIIKKKISRVSSWKEYNSYNVVDTM